MSCGISKQFDGKFGILSYGEVTLVHYNRENDRSDFSSLICRSCMDTTIENCGLWEELLIGSR